MNARNVFRHIALAIGGVALFAAMLSLPVWVQNNHIRLLQEQMQLQAEGEALRNRAALLKKEENLLVERERIEKAARERFGLDYRELPIAVAEERK